MIYIRYRLTIQTNTELVEEHLYPESMTNQLTHIIEFAADYIENKVFKSVKLEELVHQIRESRISKESIDTTILNSSDPTEIVNFSFKFQEATDKEGN